VRDEGPGIPEEIRDRLFEPFFTTKSRGTGLGLSIARRAVEAHQGSVRLESTPGAGTTVTVEVPLGSTKPAVPDSQRAADPA
jgi:signal transduction histidine kinase